MSPYTVRIACPCAHCTGRAALITPECAARLGITDRNANRATKTHGIVALTWSQSPLGAAQRIGVKA